MNSPLQQAGLLQPRAIHLEHKGSHTVIIMWGRLREKNIYQGEGKLEHFTELKQMYVNKDTLCFYDPVIILMCVI